MKGLNVSSQSRPQGIALTFLVGALVILTLVGCRRHDGTDPPGRSQSTTNSAMRLIHVDGQAGLEMDSDSIKLAGVTTATVGVENLEQTVQPTGEVAATDSGTVQVTSRLPGKIAQVFVSVGTRVHRGQLIATVDSVDLTQAEAAYQTSVAHLRLTYNQLLQQRKLAQYGALSEQPVEDAKKTFAAAQAAVASDEAQIKVDKVALENTKQLVDMGEITHKPVEDSQNAHAAAVAALAQSKVQLNSAQQNLTRAKTLYASGIYSKQQLEDAETAYNTAIASVGQNATAENLAAEELRRQENIYKQNLNGASSLQQAQSKLQQDEHTYQNDLTALELARKQLARAQTVKRSGIPISQAVQQAQDAYDEAQVAVKGAETTLRLYGVTPRKAMAQLQNGHVVIPVVAPINGIVTTRNMVVGQVTDTSTPLVKVVNLDKVFVDAQVYEKDLSEVLVGSPVQLHVAAFPGELFAGRVTYIGNEVSADTRTITVRTIIANPGWRLRPGMYATVLIGSRKRQHTMAIPADAVLLEGTRQVVYVQVAPKQFIKRAVKTGANVGGSVPVSSGLEPGDKVVVTGNVLLEQEQRKLESEKRGPA